MKNEIYALKERYAKANTKAEFDAIDLEMTRLSEIDNDTFSEAMVSLAKDTVEDCKNLVLREQLEEVLPIISMSYLAKHYFNKTRAWLHQRINGSIVNGKPARFTPAELEQFNYALQDISKKIGSLSIS